MTQLEDRLRAPAEAPLPGPAEPGDLRRRARGRNHRRRALAVAVPLVVAGLVAAAVIASTRDSGSQRVNAGPGPDGSSITDRSVDATSTTVGGSDKTVPGLQLFGVTDVQVEASRTTGLRDGDQIDVVVKGFIPLDGAVAVVCAGDVTAESAATTDCDLTPLSDQFERNNGPDGATGRATVTAARVIHLPRTTDVPSDDGAYDCAREAAECVIAIAPINTPVRAALFPVTFVDDPLAVPSMKLSRTTDLHDGDRVRVTATGLRPTPPTAWRPVRRSGR